MKIEVREIKFKSIMRDSWKFSGTQIYKNISVNEKMVSKINKDLNTNYKIHREEDYGKILDYYFENDTDVKMSYNVEVIYNNGEKKIKYSWL